MTNKLLKTLDLFVLKKFLLIFLGSFFITLFVFMMQFTWKYVNVLVGKGLTLDVLSEFFWYMGLSLVPMSLPLAILLASLISFGNMGEQLELLAMKSAGVSLLRIMRPIFLCVCLLTATSFYFQNKTAPNAQLHLRSMLFTLRQTSPALEIPEGVFYNGIPGFSLYTSKKDVKTGMLYQMMVYRTDQGFDKAQILVADSGRMVMTEDKLHLVLDVWHGEQFENLRQENFSIQKSNNVGTPYDRETFLYKRFIIDFDSNLDKLDEDQMRTMAVTKDLKQLTLDVDSMDHQLDSIGQAYYNDAQRSTYSLHHPDSVELRQYKKTHVYTVPQLDFDSVVASFPAESRAQAESNAKNQIASLASESEWRSIVSENGDAFIRQHKVKIHEKFTLSLACIFFFLIGAPLGSIIRKGGLGLPTVVSVLIFIFYYIIDTSGMKMARDGAWNMVFGRWISSAVLAPIGLYLTYKSNNDSVVFNLNTYTRLFNRIFVLKQSRHLAVKEIILYEPDYEYALNEIKTLEEKTSEYLKNNKLALLPSYKRVYFTSERDKAMREIDHRTNRLVKELANSNDSHVIHLLTQVPIFYVRAAERPFFNKRLNLAIGVLFPIGFILWLRMWRFRMRLKKDLEKLQTLLPKIQRLIEARH